MFSFMDNSGYLLGQKGGKVLNTIAADDCLMTALQCRLVSPKTLFVREDRGQKHSNELAFNALSSLNVKFRHPLLCSFMFWLVITFS